jgi:RNA polymerase sigma-B factor
MRRYAERREAGDRDAIVERFLPLARGLARRYRHSGEPLDDLFQVASLGLVKAIERFEPERGLAFTSFAVPTILGELRRHLRDTTWAIHMPRGLQERAALVARTTEQLSGRLGRSPSVQEIAELVDLTLEEVIEGLEARDARYVTSLHAERDPERDGGSTLGDTIGETDERFELIEDFHTVLPALKTLSERDRAILEMRFGEELTQGQIAQRIGVSQMQVSRLLRRALDRLRLATNAAEPS